MRKTIKIPRILKVNSIDKHFISVTFNNGEDRTIDFKKVLQSIGVDQTSPAFILFKEAEIQKLRLRNHTLSFDNVEQYIPLKNGEMERVPFEIGADVLLRYSVSESSDLILKIGELIKDARRKAGLTQEELANKSGTSRTYISRIENDRSDLELNTLKKIIEIGLGRKLEIRIK